MNYDVLISNIETLCANKGISKTKAFIECGVGKDFTSDIKRKSTKPSMEKIKAIADYFNVSIDYLLGNEQKNIPIPAIDIEIFNAYSKLSDEDKAKAMDYIRLLRKSKKK